MLYRLNLVMSLSTPRPSLSLVHCTTPLLLTTTQGRLTSWPNLTVKSVGWELNDWEPWNHRLEAKDWARGSSVIDFKPWGTEKLSFFLFLYSLLQYNLIVSTCWMNTVFWKHGDWVRAYWILEFQWHQRCHLFLVFLLVEFSQKLQKCFPTHRRKH